MYILLIKNFRPHYIPSRCNVIQGESHICIFPSDGIGRIRFTGLDYKIHSQPNASGSPKTYLCCDLAVL